MYDNLKEMPLYVYRPFYIVCMLNVYMFNVGYNAEQAGDRRTQCIQCDPDGIEVNSPYYADCRAL